MPKLLLPIVAVLVVGGSAAGASAYLLTRSDTVQGVSLVSLQETSTPTSSPTSVPTPFPTPTPTPTPTPETTPLPGPFGTLITRFFHQGQPLIYDGTFLGFWADGVFCQNQHGRIVPDYPLLNINFFSFEGGQCSSTGVNLRLCFDPGGCWETFWTGDTTIVDLDVPRDPDRDLVTARFLKDGAPAEGTISTWSYDVAGSPGRPYCAVRIVSGRNERFQRPATAVSMFWPPKVGHPLDTEASCGALGARIDVQFSSDDLGAGSGSFIVSGEDETFDVNFGAATPTPGGLPRGGGPIRGDAPLPATVTVMVALGGVLLTAGIALAALSSRRPR